MEYGFTPLEKRLRDSIMDYQLGDLLQMEELSQYLKCAAELAGGRILLTERHGETLSAAGDFHNFKPDVTKDPGRKVRVLDRTIGHVYGMASEEARGLTEQAEAFLDAMAAELSAHAEEAYLHRVLAGHVDELEVGNAGQQGNYGGKVDALTGCFNKLYFGNRLRVIERSEILPVAVICANINDWKYVNDRYGEEESNRLIRLIAYIIKKEAKPEYMIGRVDGDVFHILIPMAEEGEALAYCQRIQESCEQVEDDRLAPSIACGLATKENVEQRLEALASDAEYLMFHNKLEQKSQPEYQKRLVKG